MLWRTLSGDMSEERTGPLLLSNSGFLIFFIHDLEQQEIYRENVLFLSNSVQGCIEKNLYVLFRTLRALCTLELLLIL